MTREDYWLDKCVTSAEDANRFAATQEIQAGDWIVASTSVAASGTVDNYLHHIGAQNVRVNAQPGGYRYDFTLTTEEG